jgi:hypothetical protein
MTSQAPAGIARVLVTAAGAGGALVAVISAVTIAPGTGMSRTADVNCTSSDESVGFSGRPPCYPVRPRPIRVGPLACISGKPCSVARYGPVDMQR